MKRPIRRGSGNTDQVLDRLHDILNGGTSIGQVVGGVSIPGNLDNAHAQVTAPVAPNTDFAVTHNLNRIPTGFLPVYKSASADVYSGATPWTVTQIFLRSTVGSVTFVFQIY